MIPPLASHTRKGPERRAYKPQFRQKRRRSRSPAGPRRLGTATRISASLSRRLSAFFGSTPDQAPKAAKYAVLIPGPGMFVNVRNAQRVMIPPPSEIPVFRRVSRCVRSFSESRVCTRFRSEGKRGPFVREVENGMRSGLEQHCGGNFLAIFAGTLLDEKPNFT